MAKKYSPNDIPNKQADWGRDTTYHNYPFSGRAVQKYIKEQLDLKAGFFIPDASNENYLIFADADNYNLYMSDPVTYASLLIATVPLESNYNVRITLDNTNVINNINYGDINNVISAYFAVVNKAGNEIADNFDVTITIRNGGSQTVLHRSATYGTLFSINIDEYLQEGVNTVTLQVAAVTYKAGSSISITYNAIVLELSDNIDISEVYNSENNMLEVAVNIKGTGTKTIEWYIDNVQLEFDAQTDQTTQVETTLTRYINIGSLAEGRHTLQYRAYITIGGVNFYSKTMYRDIIVYKGVSLDTIIAVAFDYKSSTLVDSTIEPIDLGTIEQYMSKAIRYAIYNPNNVASNPMTIQLGAITENVDVSNNLEYEYEAKSFNYGNISLVFTCNGIDLEFDVEIEQSSLDIAVIGNTEFEFEGTARTNNSIDKELEGWRFTGASGSVYSALMHGFDYTERNGWTNDGLLIAAGAYVSFNCAPLNYNIAQNGGTFEFEFETRRVLDDDEVICSLLSNSAGILITASEARIISQQGVILSAKYKSEEKNRITFVVNPLQGAVNRGLVFVFINGILSGVKNYTVGDNFTSDAYLSFNGSADASIVVKQVRCYRRALRLNEVLNNYIIYRPTIEELLSVYNKNDILEAGGVNLSTEKLSAQTPIIVVTGNVQKLQNFTKADKGTYVKMDKLEVINMDDPTKNMTLVDVSMRCQGTSSMNYPKKNFRFYTQADNKDEDPSVGPYTTKMYDYQGNELIGADRLYSFKNNAQPVKCWCLKADYAESSSTHNTGTARLWNDVMKNARITSLDQRYYNQNTETPCRTQAQQAALDNDYQYDVRTAIDGFPIVLFYHEHENEPLIFLGKYNWNNDKSTESVFGFKNIPGFNNEHMECWEVVNGDYPENLFTDISNWDTDIQYEGKTMKGWQRAFEARYPDDSGKPTEATRADGALRTFAQWINGLKTAAKVFNGEVVVDDAEVMATFSSEKWAHLDVYKVAAYYVYLMRFGAVDQTVKNAMFTTEDGLHWYYINYDNDTINGLDNNGALAFGYTIDRQTIDPRSGISYCYAGHDSVLWNNLEADADFMAIVKIVDQALYNVGLNYAAVIAMYNTQQSAKWSERLHNFDSQFKYLDPFLNDDNSVGLPKLQGSRDTHRQWWLSNRFALYDAINVTGAYKANVFLVRVSTVTLDNPVNAYITPARTGQVYGYGKGGVPIVAGQIGTVDVPIAMQISDQLYVGASLDFYNAVFMKKIDLSAIAQYLTEVHLESINSAAFDSSIEEIILGNGGSEPNIGALTQLTGLGQAKYLKKLGICNFEGLTSIDLSNNKYLEQIDANGCTNLTNIIFPDAAPLTNIVLPVNLKRFALKEITTQFIHNFANTTPDIIDLRSCVIENINKTSPSLLFAWAERREQSGVTTECDVYIDNINWSNVDPQDIIDFAQYVKAHGYLTLKGVCRLTNGITLEQVSALREEFGNNCFDADAYLRFIGQGVFFVGEDDVLSGGQYQYALINATGTQITPTWKASGIQGATITQQGLVTIPEITDNDGTLTVSVIYMLDGQIHNDSKTVTVRKRVYPANATIEGDGKLEDRNTYTWSTTTQGVNGSMIAEWSLTGDLSNYAQIISQDLNSCIVALTQQVLGGVQGTLTLTLKKQGDNTTILTTTKSLSAMDENIAFTDVTDPYLMEVMYNNYRSDGVTRLAANEHYMTKLECATVVKEDLYQHLTPGAGNSIFYSNTNFRNNCTNLDNFKWFIGLTEIPDYCFFDCKFTQITIPSNILVLKSRCFYSNTIEDLSVNFLGNEIALEDYASNRFSGNFESVNITLNTTYAAVFKENSVIGTLTTASVNDVSIVVRNNVIIKQNIVDLYSSSRTGSIVLMEQSNTVIMFEGTIINKQMFSVKLPSINCKILCTENITYIGATRAFTEERLKLYLLNNTTVPQTIELTSWHLYDRGKCIVVRHDMLQAFQTAFPDIAEHFTDEFTPVGGPVDFTVTGDDVIGQAIGTILHVSKVYNGYYADGTTGQETIVEDMEQEDNFFPQNETNAPVQRTFNVTINGITKSCTINQGTKSTEYAKIKTKNVSNFVACYKNYGTVEFYLNNKKISFTDTIPTKPTIYKQLSDNDELFINCIGSYRINFATENGVKNYIKELEFVSNSNVNCLTLVKEQTYLTKVIFPKLVDSDNYLQACSRCTSLVEVFCSSVNAPRNVTDMFNNINTTGVLKYPYNADYSAMIAVLPANWTYQEI